MPQLVLTIREKRCRSAVSHYIFLLASYRALYGANWVYRYHHEYSYWQPEVWAAGAVQVRRSSRTTSNPIFSCVRSCSSQIPPVTLGARGCKVSGSAGGMAGKSGKFTSGAIPATGAV